MLHRLAQSSDISADIIIELKDERPDAELLLKVSADIKKTKHEIRKSSERNFRRVSNTKMYAHGYSHYSEFNECVSPCDKVKEIVVELFEHRNRFRAWKDNVRIFSKTISLQDDEQYTERKCTSKRMSVSIKTNADYSLADNGSATITITFLYTSRSNTKSLSV